MDTNFRADKCFLLDCGSEDAFKLLDTYAKDFEKELKVLEHNANLCAVFEFPEKIDTARGVLETMIQLIDDQRDAWAVAEDVAGFIGTSQAMLWRELVIEDIEDGSKARSRRPAMLQPFHAIDATRLHQRMRWLVFFASLSEFGRDSREMLRAGPAQEAVRPQEDREEDGPLRRRQQEHQEFY